MESGKENETLSRRKSSGGLLGKSLIPVPVTSPVINEGENCGDKVTLGSAGQKSVRRPLGTIQVNSPIKGRASETASPKDKRKPSSGSTPLRKSVLRNSVTANRYSDAGADTSIDEGVPKTPQNSPSKAKAKKTDVNKALEEQATIAYWKALAESRREALEDALKENMELHDRVEELKRSNAELEELVEEAKKLASMVEDVSEELSLDESGIGDTIAVIQQ